MAFVLKIISGKFQVLNGKTDYFCHILTHKKLNYGHWKRTVSRQENELTVV